MRRLALLATALAATAFALIAQGSGARPFDPAVGPFTGIADGHLDRVKHVHDGTTTGVSHDEYEVRFLFSFRIENGVVRGTGQGVYRHLAWHLEGSWDGGAFNCDIEVSGEPFRVRVSGSAGGGAIKLRLEVPGAAERNADYDCGSGFMGYETGSTYVADSLAFVQSEEPGGAITVDQSHPRAEKLSKTETTSDSSADRTIVHAWTIRITGPAGGKPDQGSRDGQPGGAASPSARGAAYCTVKGTSEADVLAGTPGADVLCGFGGDDTIRGRGGDDIVYGGPGDDLVDGGPGGDTLFGDAGRDRIEARDGRSDAVDGGGGKDRARVDVSKDAVRRVERVT